MIWLATICLVCAAVPCLMFLRNLGNYRPPRMPLKSPSLPAISILIPARNEERNIAAALSSVLDDRQTDFEVLVLDDHSTDRTAEIVRTFAGADSRVRLEIAPPLPEGWCGKQHACAVLAERARNELLVFMDADVRLEPGALGRMATFFADHEVALASGVPRQITETFWETLLIPQIHFVLLGFLPLHRMRASNKPAYSAGCGQLFIARADAYRACGGHSAIRASLHDGIRLPRLFREHGFKTDLFDATDVAYCRMYETGRDVLNGLAKNATEGLAAPSRIIPATLLLSLGQVMPYVLLFAGGLSPAARTTAALACVCAFLPRIIAARIFHQPLAGAILHPFGVAVLLVIQWFALFRKLSGAGSEWRGRFYGGEAIIVACALSAVSMNAGDLQIHTFELKDQHEHLHKFSFPRTNMAVVLVADHKGSKQLEDWIRPIQDQFGKFVVIAGIADVSGVPPGLHGMVRRAFVKRLSYPVMLDWSGDIVRQFAPAKNQANVYLVNTNGSVARSWAGTAGTTNLADLEMHLRKALPHR